MARLLPTTRTRREEPTDDGTTLGELDLRTAVLGVGALTAGYLVGRRLPTADGVPIGAISERAGDALPGDGVDVPIVGTDAGDGGAEDGTESGTGTDEEGGVGAMATDTSVEEVDERTNQPDGEDRGEAETTHVESNVEEEPAEPGEMQVDEDVVEEVTDADETEE